MEFDWNIAIIFTFLLLNLVLGLVFGSGIGSLEEYAIGNRKFRTATLVATILATRVSGHSFMNAINKAYIDGVFYFIAAFAGGLSAIIMGFIYAPRMKEFLGCLSIGEVMGNLYGDRIRILTAITGIIVSLGFIAVQVKVISYIFFYFFSFTGSEAVVASSLIIVTYSAMGGVNAVTLTDAVQSLAFGVFMPLVLIIAIKSAGGLEAILPAIPDSYFSLDFGTDKFKYYTVLIIYFLIPGLEPPIFQRMLMAGSVSQMKAAFNYSAFFLILLVAMFTAIGVVTLVHAPGLAGDKIVTHIMDNYAWMGIKGFAACGIIAMVMSTADSYINASAVMFVHDFYKLTRNEEKEQPLSDLNLARVFAAILGLAAIIIALNFKDLIRMILTVQSFYMPVITVPLTLAILGFRSTTRAVTIGMIAGAVTVIAWELYFEKITGIGSLLPGMFANTIFLFLAHYYFDHDPGTNGWVGPKSKGPLKLLKIRRKKQKAAIAQFFANLPSNIMNFNLLQFCDKYAWEEKKHHLAGASFVLAMSIWGLIRHVDIIDQDMSVLIYTGMLLFPTLVIITSLDISEKYIAKFQSLTWMLFCCYNFIFAPTFITLSNLTILGYYPIILGLGIFGLVNNWLLTMIAGPILVAASFYLHLDIYGSSIGQALYVVESVVIACGGVFYFSRPNQAKIAIQKDTIEYKDKQIACKDKQNHILMQSVVRLQKAEQYIINNVSHESRVALSAMTSALHYSLDQAMRDALTPEERNELLINAKATLSRMEHFNAGLTDLAQLRLDNNLFELQLHLLLSLLNQAIEDANKELQLEGLETREFVIESSLKEDQKIRCDLRYMQSAFVKILKNAAEYSEDGVIRIVMKELTPAEQSNKEWRRFQISIIDQGIGIPEGEIKQIFKPFFESGATKTEAQGKGIGLAIVREIIVKHQGKVSIANNQDSKGATVDVVLYETQPVDNMQAMKKKIVPAGADDLEDVEHEMRPLAARIRREVEENIRFKSKKVCVFAENSASQEKIAFHATMMGYDTYRTMDPVTNSVVDADFVKNNIDDIAVIVINTSPHGVNAVRFIKDNIKLLNDHNITVIAYLDHENELQRRYVMDEGAHEFIIITDEMKELNSSMLRELEKHEVIVKAGEE